MKAATGVLLACAALVMAAGCGSSGSSSRTATSPALTSSGLKPNTTPQFVAPSASAPVRSGLVAIAYRNISIAPDTVRVKVGSTVSWMNYDSVEHNVTSSDGPTHIASGNFGEGMSFQIKLSTPGVIHYLCTIHPASMNGTIEVVR